MRFKTRNFARKKVRPAQNPVLKYHWLSSKVILPVGLKQDDYSVTPFPELHPNCTGPYPKEISTVQCFKFLPVFSQRILIPSMELKANRENMNKILQPDRMPELRLTSRKKEVRLIYYHTFRSHPHLLLHS